MLQHRCTAIHSELLLLLMLETMLCEPFTRLLMETWALKDGSLQPLQDMRGGLRGSLIQCVRQLVEHFVNQPLWLLDQMVHYWSVIVETILFERLLVEEI
jgi:hypothetical protein